MGGELILLCFLSSLEDMGAAFCMQSVAQSTMNRVAVRFASTTLSEIPDSTGDVKLVGTIDNTMSTTTNLITALDATVRSSRATLEVPPTSGVDGSGEFAHFVFPDLEVRVGTQSST